MKLFKLSTLAVSLVLSTTLLTACGNKQENSTDSGDTGKAEEVQSAETNDSPVKGMTQVTLDNIPVITAIYKAQEGVTDEQKACLDKIDLSDSSSELAKTFSDNFSDEELSEALAIFNDPEVKKGTAYGMQMIQAASGVEIKDPIAAPSPETMKKLQDFGGTDLGKKLQGFSGADDLMQQKISVKVKECGIEGDM